MAGQRAPDFGHKLREARERRGLSLRQIANATKISILTLEALEKNDIGRLPGGIFSRAFVRAYAAEVGLDPEKTIQEFMGQFPHDSVTAGHPTTARIEDTQSVDSERRVALTILRLVGVSVPLAAAVLYFAGSGRIAVTEAPKPVAAPVAADRVLPAPRPASSPTATIGRENAAAGAFLTVQVMASKPSWISAIVDGEKTVDRLFAAGDERTLEVRRELVLTAADAGAVALTLNGAAAKPLGRNGQAVTARLNPSNFKDYLPAP